MSAPQSRLTPVTSVGSLFGPGGVTPKFSTHTVSSPSTVTPHGSVMPPPVNGELACGERSFARNIVTEGCVALPSTLRVGHGESSQSEFATQTLPWLSTVLPIGFVMTVLPLWVDGSVAISVPAGESTYIALLRLPVTHRLPWRSMTVPNGLICGSFAGGAGPSGMLTARAGSPPGNTVTVSLPQLAIEMLPWRSDEMPCGHEMLPCVNPCGGEIAAPSRVNSDTLFFVAFCGRNSHGGSWKPKFAIHNRPRRIELHAESLAAQAAIEERRVRARSRPTA